MKKIIIVSDSLRIGGIQKSLRNLLDVIDYNKYDVSLLLFNDNYPNDLNKNIHLLKSNSILRIIGLTKKEAKEKGKITYLIRLLLAVFCKLFGSDFVYNMIYLFTKKQRGYDIALSYSNNGSPKTVYYGYNKFVLKKVQAKTKMTYLHVDYETMNMDNKKNRIEYEQFDKILTVSEYAKKMFLKYNKDSENKVEVLYNTIPININTKMKNPYNTKKFIITTAGRLDDNKDPLLQIEIAKELVTKKLDFKWYFIGDGNLRKEVEEKIKEYKLEKYVCLLGNKQDVYPYLKFANVYVSTSKSESYGLSIVESLLLNTVVVAKEYPALHEIITDNGFICKDKQEIINILEKLMKSEDFYNNSLKKSILNIDNKKIMKKFDKIFKGV